MRVHAERGEDTLMGVTGESVRRTVADAPLRASLERLLAGSACGSRRIVGMRREPSALASLYPTEAIALCFDDGSELSLFVKHLGDEQADHPDKQCRDREIRIYEELLGDAGLPVVEFFGWSVDEETQRRALFLEHVPDWDLRYQELEHWYTAARRLADLHAHFAARVERIARSECLLRLDGEYLHGWAERALRVVEGYEPGLGAALSGVVTAYRDVAEPLEQQPATLVHNDLAPKNVLAHRASRPARIAFVDWEMAGVGCGVLDLVDLTFGLDVASRERMRAAYRDALIGTTLLPSDAVDVERLFIAAELHRTLYRLAHSASWWLPVETVRRWVADARRLMTRIRR